jgi:hypothetical protein
MLDATVKGRMEFNGAALLRPGDVAMLATNLTAGIDMSCRPAGDLPFEVEGDLVFVGARIYGSLFLNGAVIRSPRRIAIDGTGMVVNELSLASLAAGDGDGAPTFLTRVVGQISLAGVDATRFLDLSGAPSCR